MQILIDFIKYEFFDNKSMHCEEEIIFISYISIYELYNCNIYIITMYLAIL